ncbi:3-methyl-2-oxobutanoate hydroxymethyltransferase, partial [candidate division WOR-3 bacterium]|nr:3-methyl-2-oxobutanoate hydroxymethyltransferase [candidate division WOR-3 bacterium]
ESGMVVMGHIGLTPQSIHKLGGYKLQGRTEKEGARLIKDAELLESAGCFSIVLEKIPSRLAKKITKTISIPTIGIGAGSDCDGQVLVLHDILGLFKNFTPKFVKQYAHIGDEIRKAVQQYRDEVKKGIYPDEKHSF